MSHSRPLIKLDIDLETGIGVLIGPTGVRVPLDEVAATEAAAARGDAAAIAAITAFHGGVLPDDDEPDAAAEPMTHERAQALLAEQMHHCPLCAENPEVLAAGYLDADGRIVDTTNQMRAARGQAPLRDDPNWWHGKRIRRARRGRR